MEKQNFDTLDKDIITDNHGIKHITITEVEYKQLIADQKALRAIDGQDKDTF